MIRGFYTAESGMVNGPRMQETVAASISNLGTPGYKGKRSGTQEFAGVLAPSVGSSGPPIPIATRRVIGRVGTGAYVEGPADGELGASSDARVAGITRDPAQGTRRPTERRLDFAIVGTGCFRIRLENGAIANTRDGVFGLDGKANLVTQSGDSVEPGLDLPIDFSDMRISADGTMTVVRPQTQVDPDALPDAAPRDGTRVEVGRTGLSGFVTPGGLEAIGENLFQATAELQTRVEGACYELDATCIGERLLDDGLAL